MNTIRKFLSPPPPVFDSENNRLARLLNIFFLGAFVTCLSIFPIMFGLGASVVWYWANLGILFVCVIAYALLKAGYVHWTGVLVVVVGNGLAVMVNVSGRHPFSVIAVSGMLVVLIVGLFASWRGLILTLIASVSVTIATTIYLLAFPVNNSTQADLLIDATAYIWYLLVIGFVVFLSVREFQTTLRVARESRQKLNEQNDILRQEMIAAETLRRQQEEFIQKLHAVTNSANTLMQCETMDALWQKAVITAHDVIGLERCSIFLLDKEQRYLTGTYGITGHGTLVFEQQHRFSVESSAIVQNLLRTMEGSDAIWDANPDADLHEWDGVQSLKIGRSWMVNTLIRPEQSAPIAVFFNDAGLSKHALDLSKQELLAVFCSLLANVAQRKQQEIQQRQRAQGLRQVVLSADELLNTTSLAEFWARATKHAHQRLGFERISIYALENQVSGLFRGTYGVDLSGNLVDVSHDTFFNRDWAEEQKQRRADPNPSDWRYQDDVELQDAYEGRMLPIGRGWLVQTPVVSDNGQLLGIIFNDAIISGVPVNPEQQDLLSAFARILGNIGERKQEEERQSRLTAALRDVLKVTDELMTWPDMENFWRAAVEMARKRLGVERASVWLRDQQDPNSYRATFGTDIFHKTTDERGQSLKENEALRDLKLSPQSANTVWKAYENVQQSTWHGGRYLFVQQGWQVVTPINNAQGERIGVFCNDTAISHRPMSSDQQDVIALYCSLLGSIAERKMLEQHLQDDNVTLENRVQERTLQLHNSEKYFRTIIQQSSDSISVMGLDGKIQFESPSAQRMFGHESRVGQNAFDLIHPEDVNGIAHAMLGGVGIEALPNTIFAARVLHVDGHWIDTETKISLLYDDAQQVQAIVASARDVSERKKMEGALRESEARFRHIANASPMIMWISDQHDRNEFVNQAYLDFYGLTPDQVMGDDWKVLIHPDDLIKLDLSARTTLTAGEKLVYEWRTRPKDGDYRWVLNTICRRYDEGGNFLGYIGAAVDVTERKQAEQALQRKLAFDHALAEISKHLSGLPIDHMDQGVAFALAALGTALDADVCRVMLYSLDRAMGVNTYEWCAPSVPSTYQQLQDIDWHQPEMNWWLQQFKEFGRIYYKRVDDMPDDVMISRARMKAIGVVSLVRVPLTLGDQVVGELGLDTLSDEREWYIDDINLLHVIAENISSALTRQHANSALARRVHFEQVVADISSHFLQLSPDQIRSGIDYALQRLGQFTQVNICRIFEYSADGLYSTNTHEWCSVGVPPQKAFMQKMPRNKDSWWQRQLNNRQLIYFTDLSEMPPEAENFRKLLIRKGVKALTSIALIRGDQVIGELGLDSVEGTRIWSDDDMRLLRLVSELISNALARESAYREISTQARSRQLIADISSSFVRQPIDKIDEAIQDALLRVGQYAGVNICSLYEIAEDRSVYSNTHEWCGEFISSQMDVLQNQPFAADTWWWQTLQTQRMIWIDDVAEDQIVPENIRQELMSRGVQSSLAIAIFQNNVLIGELGLDAVMQKQRWPAETVQVIEVIADLIGNAFQRKYSAQTLQRERDLLEKRVTERTNEINKLLDVSKTVNSTLELQPLLNLILDQLKGVVAYDALAITEFNESESKILLFEGPVLMQNASNSLSSWSYDTEQDVHITDLIVHRHPVIVPDVQAETPFAQAVRWRYEQMHSQVPVYMASILYVPLIVRDRVMGIMALYSGASQFYTEHHAQLAVAFANLAAVAIENARLYEQAVQSAALTERSRLARELHDSVSQALFGIVLGARTVLHNGRKNDAKLLEPMEYVLKLSEAALAEMRALIFELRPESLQNEGLLIAFQKQAEALCARHRVDVKTDLGDQEPPIALAAKEALYRIGLEAVQNTIKHADATRIDLRLRVLIDHVTLEVQDDGHGFDTNGKYPGHFGLHSMRERAEQLGGSLDLNSVLGQGTFVQVRIPIQAEHTPLLGQQPLAV